MACPDPEIPTPVAVSRLVRADQLTRDVAISPLGVRRLVSFAQRCTVKSHASKASHSYAFRGPVRLISVPITYFRYYVFVLYVFVLGIIYL